MRSHEFIAAHPDRALVAFGYPPHFFPFSDLFREPCISFNSSGGGTYLACWDLESAGAILEFSPLRRGSCSCLPAGVATIPCDLKQRLSRPCLTLVLHIFGLASQLRIRNMLTAILTGVHLAARGCGIIAPLLYVSFSVNVDC